MLVRLLDSGSSPEIREKTIGLVDSRKSALGSLLTLIHEEDKNVPLTVAQRVVPMLVRLLDSGSSPEIREKTVTASTLIKIGEMKITFSMKVKMVQIFYSLSMEEICIYTPTMKVHFLSFFLSFFLNTTVLRSSSLFSTVFQQSKTMSESESKESAAATATTSLARKSKSLSLSGILKILLIVFIAKFSSSAYKATLPPPPKLCGSPNGPPITTPRVKLQDGRHLSYVELGVPKDVAKSKLIYVHCFDCSKYLNPFAAASPDVIEELGVYIVSLDRPGYGESDPDPKRTVKSLALDIEEFANLLNLGPKFYVAGFSMGGQVIWSCLKYIPHRLAGAVLISPAINYWWRNLPSNLTNQAYSQLLPQDQWTYRVAHHLPWLSHWWNSQKMFHAFSVISGNPDIFSFSDLIVVSKLLAPMDPNQLKWLKSQARLQGEFESIHRDLNIGFGKWDFDPMDLENPFPNNDGSVHLWMGDEDNIVPLTIQRYIAQQLEWVDYHEVNGGGHTFAFGDGMQDVILKTLLKKKY
ncbi:hypothetical protein L1987_81475 [Smallanthus sonchifolius]|uniref:Uncharacterized protein n=1 Tax=Smallanthus sonchifolius TaxID=185202 RepID=A0ACB8YPV6_9ASTR|nr:hypothetical protein L1987_81475 [Smallanthus sonchifolius]